MNWRYDRKCTCGHTHVTHRSRRQGCVATIRIRKDLLWVGISGKEYCCCNKFNLDNLAYIEALAEERGLV